MRLLALAALAAATATPVLAGAPAGLAQMQTQMLAPTVQLDNNCSGQIIFSCADVKSGKVETYILTAAHCIADMGNKDISVQVPEFDDRLHKIAEHVYFGGVFVQGYKADLAIVELRDHATVFANVARLAPLKTALYEGEDTWTVGYPLGANRVLTEGKLGEACVPIGRVLLAELDQRADCRHVEAAALGLGVDLLDVVGEVGFLSFETFDSLHDGFQLVLCNHGVLSFSISAERSARSRASAGVGDGSGPLVPSMSGSSSRANSASHAPP